MIINAMDLFSGAGGLTQGMKDAGFNVVAAVDNFKPAQRTYRLNHPEVKLFSRKIQNVYSLEIKALLKNEQLHLLAGCPPCQGFSSVRRLNKKDAVNDDRNDLILQFNKFVKKLKPLTIMMENVPALENYDLFLEMTEKWKKNGYFLKYESVDIQNYGVPQRRKRLILVGSRLGEIDIVHPTNKIMTVRDAIGDMESVNDTDDPMHKTAVEHIPRIMKMIQLIPKNGGSRKELPTRYILKCHKRNNIGFNDIYGRLKWDTVSVTMTGGCLNPSKGRFLHPDEDRCITAREASLIQTFKRDYKFSKENKAHIGSLIGNALPPKFARIQSKNIMKHLLQHKDKWADV